MGNHLQGSTFPSVIEQLIAHADAHYVRDGFPGGPPVIEIDRISVEHDQGVYHLPGSVRTPLSVMPVNSFRSASSNVTPQRFIH